MFENGEIDTMGLDSLTLEKYRDDPRTKQNLSLSCQHIDINSLKSDNPILQTLNFRKALFYAIDREVTAEIEGAYLLHIILTTKQVLTQKGITYRETPEAQAIVPEIMGMILNWQENTLKQHLRKLVKHLYQ